MQRLGQYPGSESFRSDALAFARENPALNVSSSSSDDKSAAALFRAMQNHPTDSWLLKQMAAWEYLREKKFMQSSLHTALETMLGEEWDQVCAELPADLPEPNLPPFSEPFAPTSGSEAP